MKKIFSFLLLSYLAFNSFAQDKIYKGSKVSILEIDKSDTYYSERADFLGKDATALGDLTKNSNGYYSGTLEMEGGRTCFFKYVRVSKLADEVKSTTTALKGTIPKGTAFIITEISSDDSYYKDRSTILGKTGVTTDILTTDDNGYISGSVKTSDGSSYYFYKVKFAKNGSSSTSYTTSSTTPKKVKFVTGTIAKGERLYVAEISPDDSYYSDRFEKVGARGKVDKQSMTMKEDGWYAGDFLYDDGTTAYFYKAKFSKEPVDKLAKTDEQLKASTSLKTDNEWDDARNDENIKSGDKVEVTAVSTEDSYYEDKDDYLGKQGIAGDVTYDEDAGGYGGTVKLDDGNSPYFYLVKLKKIKSGSTSSSSSSSMPETIAKNTKVKVIDIDSDDSFYSSKSTYIGKSGKVAEGLNRQGDGLYSGKILFNDGTDAYFFKAKIQILK